MMLQLIFQGVDKIAPLEGNLMCPSREDQEKILSRIPVRISNIIFSTSERIQRSLKVVICFFRTTKEPINTTVGCPKPFVDASNDHRDLRLV